MAFLYLPTAATPTRFVSRQCYCRQNIAICIKPTTVFEGESRTLMELTAPFALNKKSGKLDLTGCLPTPAEMTADNFERPPLSVSKTAQQRLSAFFCARAFMQRGQEIVRIFNTKCAKPRSHQRFCSRCSGLPVDVLTAAFSERFVVTTITT